MHIQHDIRARKEAEVAILCNGMCMQRRVCLPVLFVNAGLSLSVRLHVHVHLCFLGCRIRNYVPTCKEHMHMPRIESSAVHRRRLFHINEDIGKVEDPAKTKTIQKIGPEKDGKDGEKL